MNKKIKVGDYVRQNQKCIDEVGYYFRGLVLRVDRDGYVLGFADGQDIRKKFIRADYCEVAA